MEEEGEEVEAEQCDSYSTYYETEKFIDDEVFFILISTMEAIKFHLYKVPMHINHSEPSFLLVMLLNSDKQNNKIRSSINFSEFVPS